MKQTFTRKAFALALFFAFSAFNLFSQTVFVKTDGVPFTNLASHSTWETASNDLQAAIDAVAVLPSGGEVWVQRGVYIPMRSFNGNPADPKTWSFVIKNNVAVYGGFVGVETSLEQRDLTDNEAESSVLSGDVGVINVATDNSSHVVYGTGLNNTAILDGFFIKDGYANDDTHVPYGYRGGGIHSRDGGVFRNLIVVNNYAQYGGGGVYAYKGGLFENCWIMNNTTSATGIGGGVYSNMGGDFIHCIILSNAARKGAGIFTEHSLIDPVSVNSKFINCAIGDNMATHQGGGVYVVNGGNFINNIVANNETTSTSGEGGGFYIDGNANVVNTTISRNVANDMGGAVYIKSTANFVNAIVWGNNSVQNPGNQVYAEINDEADYFHYSALGRQPVAGADWAGDNLLTLNADNSHASGPQFVRPTSFSGAASLQADPVAALTELTSTDWTVALTSPCFNSGNPVTDGLGLPEFDFEGHPRIIQSRIDMGAMETVYYTVSVSATEGGVVSPVGVTNVLPDGEVVLTVTPDAERFILRFTDNGIDRMGDLVEESGVFTYTLSGINSNHDIQVTFDFYHTITSSTSLGGIVTPLGATQVLDGGDATYALDPEDGYELFSILLDEVEQELPTVKNPDGTYTYVLQNVTADHTLEIVFKKYFTVNVTASLGGTVTPMEAMVFEGDNLPLTIVPDENHDITSFEVNGSDVIADLLDNEDGSFGYTITNMVADVNVDVVFTAYYMVTITSGTGGVIDPAVDQMVYAGDDLPLLITPDVGYHISVFTINGVDELLNLNDNLDGTFSFTLTAIDENLAVVVEYAVNTYTLTVSASAGGTITNLGVSQIVHGSNVDFIITPAVNYAVASFMVDDVEMIESLVDEGDGTFTFSLTNVVAAHTVDVDFTNTTSIGDGPSGKVVLYPNPASEKLFVTGISGNVAIYNRAGMNVGVYTEQQYARGIEIKHLPAGVYLLKYSAGKALKTMKFVVK
jgi:hypothetical protein